MAEFRHAAEMIAVIMRQDQMIDLGQTGITNGLHDAAGIAFRGKVADIAGVDQDRFAGRRDEQGPVSALDVHDINIQSVAGLRRDGGSRKQQGSKTNERAHGISSLDRSRQNDPIGACDQRQIARGIRE